MSHQEIVMVKTRNHFLNHPILNQALSFCRPRFIYFQGTPIDFPMSYLVKILSISLEHEQI